MNQALIVVALFFTFCYLSFIAGCVCGRSDIDELEANGYKLVRHEVRHGDFHTNWVEVVRK